jgi:glycosyltransferase involved in cell wall biosynthesis
MRILIWTTGNAFTPSMLYKENYIIKAALEHGDSVMVLASKYRYVDGREMYVSEDECFDDYVLKRFDYKPIINEFVTRKVRFIPELISQTIGFHPDLVFVNCAQVYNIKFLKQIKNALPDVKIVLDFSTKYLNSAGNWLSKNVLHRVVYRRWIQDALPSVDNIFYISAESRDFAHEMYDIPFDRMEHNNLPGETIPLTIKQRYRREIRERLGFKGDDIFFLYSGKIYPEKKITELVKAFSSVCDKRFRLLIIGVYQCDVRYKNEVEQLIRADSRITFMSFVSGSELTKYVCACDLYVQPGSISQTCQTAVCCGTPLCFNDIPTHREIYNGNGFFADNEEQLSNVFRMISVNDSVLEKMSSLSYDLAGSELDYKIIYKKILRSVSLDSLS